MNGFSVCYRCASQRILFEKLSVSHQKRKWWTQRGETISLMSLTQHHSKTGTNTTNATSGEIHESCDATVWMPSDDAALNFIQGFHLMCYLWANQLVLAISCCTIAGAVCKWYVKHHSLTHITHSLTKSTHTLKQQQVLDTTQRLKEETHRTLADSLLVLACRAISSRISRYGCISGCASSSHSIHV